MSRSSRYMARLAMVAGSVLAAVAAWAANGTTERPRPTASVPSVLRSAAVQAVKAPRAAMIAVTRAGARIIAVGERGVVLLSDDNGASWRQAITPVQVSLTAVQFVDPSQGWAVGHLGVILHTKDGGERWDLQLDGVRAAQLHAQAMRSGRESDERVAAEAQRWIADGPDKPFFDVSFSDGRNGIVVGAFNSAFTTQDGGTTWRSVAPQLPNPKLNHLYAVRRDRERLYIAGEQGLLLRSSDGGASFESLPSPYSGSFFGLHVTEARTLLGFGLRGRVFRSVDGGQHWQHIQSGTSSSIAAGTDLPGARTVLLSQDGRVLVSTDDGKSFRISDIGVEAPAPGIVSTQDGSLVLASLRGLRRLPAP